MGMSGAPAPIVDRFRRVRRRMSAPRLLVFLPSALTRVPIVASPSDYGLPRPLHELALHRLHLPWTCRAGRAGTRIRSEALHRILPADGPAAVRAGARPYQIRGSLKARQNPSSLTSTRPRSVLFSQSWRVIAGLTLVLPEESPNTERQHAP